MTFKTIKAWLRAALSRLRRRPRGDRLHDITADKVLLRRRLGTRLPARLLKDIGADDG